MSLCSEMVFSLFWSSRHNQIDTMVSGSGMFPFPDTKGMDTAIGMVLGGEIASEPLFPACFKPWVLLTHIFSFALKTPLFFPLLIFNTNILRGARAQEILQESIPWTSQQGQAIPQLYKHLDAEEVQEQRTASFLNWFLSVPIGKLRGSGNVAQLSRAQTFTLWLTVFSENTVRVQELGESFIRLNYYCHHYLLASKEIRCFSFLIWSLVLWPKSSSGEWTCCPGQGWAG